MRTDRLVLGASLLMAACIMPAAPSHAMDEHLVVLIDRGFDGSGNALAVTRIDSRDGAIVTSPVGSDRPIPVIDARGFVVVPGFIDLRSGVGLDASNEEGSEITPDVRASDLVDWDDLGFDAAIASGVTTAVVAPGGRAVISGVATPMKTHDGSRNMDIVWEIGGVESLVGGSAALVITLGDEPSFGNRMSRFQTPTGVHFRRPGNRMGVVSEIRRTLLAARDAADDASPVLRRALAGTLPIWWRARTEQDIRTAIRLSQELELPPPVLLDPVEAHRVPELVAKHCRAAVIGPSYQIPRSLLEVFEGEDFRHATPKLLHDAGAVVAIGSGPDDPPGVLRDRAALAVRAGLPANVALAAITSVPAALLGLSDRLGDLTPGHDADMVILDGDPFLLTSRVLVVIVEGRIAWTSPDAPAGLRLPAPPSAPVPVPVPVPVKVAP